MKRKFSRLLIKLELGLIGKLEEVENCLEKKI